jgi:signal peptidase I
LAPARGAEQPSTDPGVGGAKVERTFGQKVGTRDNIATHPRRTIRRWGLALAGGLALFRLCCPFSIGVVQGSSMTPTYRPGQLFLLDRHYYQNHPIRRGDVVVVQCDNHTMIKRVFGVAGDSIWLLVQTDGNKFERWVIDPTMLPRLRRAAARWDIGRLTHLKVPPGAVYLLGDCTEASIDSRSFGTVPTSAILGIVNPLRPGIGPAALKK